MSGAGTTGTVGASANEWNRRISPLPHADTLRTGPNYLQQLICLMFGWGMLGVHSLAIGTRFVLSLAMRLHHNTF